ncbi:hypothetical protein [Williamsia sp. DF01-3]|uniref:hypothetical protein n=1 Tax=Williamsia sp. DF01-3 TaxID=2934157 RepID=UPI001FF128A2|nr:hypothetical protein [Williamsia sp. DF01-3]MCK0515929.1 hypothetical protein [Williamsia sp. DF01-3]
MKPYVAFTSISRAAAATGMAAGPAAPVAVKLIDPIPTVDLYLVWCSTTTNPAVNAFIDCMDDTTTYNRPAKSPLAPSTT